MLDQQSPTSAASAPPVIVLPPRQEAFCQAMAANVGGAEAARRAGYSPNGAKQRGAHLMTMPEIRIRVDQLRAARSAGIEVELKEAAETVKAIIADAMEKKQCALALRAVELRLKLCGIMLDKRIPHHFTAAPHPDADLEAHDPDPAEENDGRTYLHRGIATRAFERKFTLADHVRVDGASHVDGMLHIDLVREIPEALKPRRIEIAKTPARVGKLDA